MRVYVDGRPGWRVLDARTVAGVWAEVEALTGATGYAPGTVGHGIRRYMTEAVPALMAEGRMAASTWRTEERRCERLLEAFGRMHPDAVQTRHLYAAGDAAPDGWRRIKRLSAIWRYLMRWGYTDSDPFRRIQWPRQRARDRYVTDEELAQACAVALEAAERRPSALMAWAALRLVELTGRRVTDVRTIRLDQISDDGIRFRESKTGKLVMIEMSPALAEAIRDIKARLHAGKAARPMTLLCNRDGQPVSEGSLNQAWQRLRPALTEAGIAPFQLRDLRGKYGSDHEDGAGALGHSSPAVFRKHYARKPRSVKPLR